MEEQKHAIGPIVLWWNESVNEVHLTTAVTFVRHRLTQTNRMILSGKRSDTPELKNAPTNSSLAWVRSFPASSAFGPVLFFVAYLAFELSHFRAAYSVKAIEGGDSAAYSLQVVEAKHLALLRGNYSRVGINHPGPAILYVMAAGEGLFHDVLKWTASPFAGQQIGLCVYLAGFLALWQWCASLMLGPFRAMAGTATFILASLQVPTPVLASSWFPHLYYAPFAVMLIAATVITLGFPQALPVFALAAVTLVHGHVAFALPVLAFTLIIAVSLLMRRNISRGQVIASGLVIAAGLLPIVLDTIVNYPGQILDYLRVSGTSRSFTFSQTIHFIGDYWKINEALSVGAIVTLSLAMITKRVAPHFIGAAVVATLCLYLYGSRFTDSQDFYLGIFYLSVPASMAAVGLASLLPRRPVLAISAAAVFLALAAYTFPKTFYFDLRNPADTVALSNELPTDEPIRIVLDPRPNEWAPQGDAVLQLLLYRDRNLGRSKQCLDEGGSYVVFTRAHSCGSKIFRGKSLRAFRVEGKGDFKPVTQTQLPVAFDVSSDTTKLGQVTLNGWRGIENGALWGLPVDPLFEPSVIVTPDTDGPALVSVTLTAKTPQRVAIKVNGIPVQDVTAAPLAATMSFPVQLTSGRGLAITLRCTAPPEVGLVAFSLNAQLPEGY